MRAGFALALVLAVATPALAGHWWEDGPPLPRMTGQVVDDAHLLTDAQEADISGRLAKLERTTGDQLIVVTTASLRGQTIEQFGIRLGRTWGIGRKSADDGVLLIIAPNERNVRIEVGYGLEKQLSDPTCARIIRDAIRPRFEAGDFAGGIKGGVIAIIGRIGNKRA